MKKAHSWKCALRSFSFCPSWKISFGSIIGATFQHKCFVLQNANWPNLRYGEEENDSTNYVFFSHWNLEKSKSEYLINVFIVWMCFWALAHFNYSIRKLPTGCGSFIYENASFKMSIRQTLRIRFKIRSSWLQKQSYYLVGLYDLNFLTYICRTGISS